MDIMGYSRHLIVELQLLILKNQINSFNWKKLYFSMCLKYNKIYYSLITIIWKLICDTSLKV